MDLNAGQNFELDAINVYTLFHGHVIFVRQARMKERKLSRKAKCVSAKTLQFFESRTDSSDSSRRRARRAVVAFFVDFTYLTVSFLSQMTI